MRLIISGYEFTISHILKHYHTIEAHLRESCEVLRWLTDNAGIWETHLPESRRLEGWDLIATAPKHVDADPNSQSCWQSLPMTVARREPELRLHLQRRKRRKKELK